MRAARYSSLSFALAAALFVLPACSAKQSDTRSVAPQRSASRGDVEHRVRAAYEQWRGSRHKLGGKTKGGIDCSGFVQLIYKDTFNVALPRTTKQLAKAGEPVKRSQLRAGDLVFFKPDSYPRHVGIYLSGGEFVHVSARKGVMISRTDSQYWSRHYWTARRILS